MRTSNVKYLFLLPGMLVILVTAILPVLSVINLSFQEWEVARSPFEPTGYVGLENYVEALSDDNFWNSVGVTVAYVIISVFFSVVIGIFIAVMVQRVTFLSTVVKSILIFPFAISLTLRGYSFRFMLLEGQGVLDTIIDAVFPPFADILWLAHPYWALFWVAVPTFWAWGPLAGLMLLGALNNISSEIFEAASLDGASRWRTFWNITLPLLRPMIFVLVLLITLFSIRMFDLVLTMTFGGPGNATETLNFFIYRIGFRIFNMGYAAALAMILTIILIVLSYLYSRVLINE